MRDDQPYYYFDGYKMGQEEKKSKEHQGHHCSGKCTKLPMQKMPYDHLLPKQEQPKEKDCEHDWEYCELPNGEHSKKISNCKKCPALKSDQDPFWLKVGDVIKQLNTNFLIKLKKETNFDNIKIEGYEAEILSSDGIKRHGVLLKKDLTPDKFKKIKLVSPALLKIDSTRCRLSTMLYSYAPEVVEEEMGGYFTSKSIMWPAKDQFGREIWMEVE